MLNIRSRLDVGMVEVRVGKILVSLSLRCVFGVGKIAAAFSQIILRSEERRVGKECRL